MDTTRSSLLQRLQNRDDSVAWSEFQDLYGPIIYRCARLQGLGHDDAEDVCATCFEAIVRQVDQFHYDRQRGSFKSWLKTMVRRRVIDLLRKHRPLSADPHLLTQRTSDQPAADQLWETEWRQQHLRFCIHRAKHQVPVRTFEVFELLVDREMAVPHICQQLDMTPNQVYKAKARFLDAVRAEMARLDEE